MSTPGSSLRVLIIDDQPVAIAGTIRLLAEHGIDTVASVDNIRRLNDVYREHRPDVVVIETAIGNDGSAWAAIAALLAANRRAAVLAFTCQLSAASVHAALDVGCLGVAPKTCPADALNAAVRDVARGERHLHPRAMATLLADMHANEPRPGVRSLSQRELGVLALVADGLGNIEIASVLGIGEATVKTHVTGVLRKLNARDRAHAVSTALRLGVLS